MRWCGLGRGMTSILIWSPHQDQHSCLPSFRFVPNLASPVHHPPHPPHVPATTAKPRKLTPLPLHIPLGVTCWSCRIDGEQSVLTLSPRAPFKASLKKQRFLNTFCRSVEHNLHWLRCFWLPLMAPSSVVILLIGLHGSGKSTFAKAATRRDNIKIGKGLVESRSIHDHS